MSVQTLVWDPAPQSIVESYAVSNESNILDTSHNTYASTSSNSSGDIEFSIPAAPFDGTEEIVEVRIKHLTGQDSPNYTTVGQRITIYPSSGFAMPGLAVLSYSTTKRWFTAHFNATEGRTEYPDGSVYDTHSYPWGINPDREGDPTIISSSSSWASGLSINTPIKHGGYTGQDSRLYHVIIEIDYIPSNVVDVKHSGVWKESTPFTKHSGVWKEATPSAKQSGTWKEST